jgi:hypothetical protein
LSAIRCCKLANQRITLNLISHPLGIGRARNQRPSPVWADSIDECIAQVKITRSLPRPIQSGLHREPERPVATEGSGDIHDIDVVGEPTALDVQHPQADATGVRTDGCVARTRGFIGEAAQQ